MAQLLWLFCSPKEPKVVLLAEIKNKTTYQPSFGKSFTTNMYGMWTELTEILIKLDSYDVLS